MYGTEGMEWGAPHIVLGFGHGWDSAILSFEGFTDHFESVMKDKVTPQKHTYRLSPEHLAHAVKRL